jgi:hypothetical protein
MDAWLVNMPGVSRRVAGRGWHLEQGQKEAESGDARGPDPRHPVP